MSCIRVLCVAAAVGFGLCMPTPALAQTSCRAVVDSGGGYSFPATLPPDGGTYPNAAVVVVDLTSSIGVGHSCQVTPVAPAWLSVSMQAPIDYPPVYYGFNYSRYYIPLTISVGPNTTGQVRSGYISVAVTGGHENIAGTYLPVVSQSSGGCTYALSETSTALLPAGGRRSVGLLASKVEGCGTWTATSNKNWVRVLTPATGTRASEIAYTLDTNPTTAPRSATITVAGLTFAITQAGSQTCPFALTPISELAPPYWASFTYSGKDSELALAMEGIAQSSGISKSEALKGLKVLDPPAVNLELDRRMTQFAQVLAPYGGGVRTSGYRPRPYQHHFWDISQTRKKLLALQDPVLLQKCASLKEQVKSEATLHGLQPSASGGYAVNAPGNSAHELGLALDVSMGNIPVSRQRDIDVQARTYQLVRTVYEAKQMDAPHFERSDAAIVAHEWDYWHVASPVAVLLTAPDGRRIGFDSASGQWVNELGSGAWYSDTNEHPFTIAIERAPAGTYTMSGVGTGTGTYTVTVERQLEDLPPVVVQTTTGTTSEGETIAPIQVSLHPPRNDGIPAGWKVAYGLNPYSDAVKDGPNGDTDNDGLSNAQEFAAGTHPNGPYVRHFAEGATGALFDTSLALMNPGQTPATVLVRFLRRDAQASSLLVTVPALSRATVNPREDASLAAHEFGMVIESDVPVVADRTMTWDRGRYGAHTEASVAAPASTWYLAEGATHSGFNLFYLLQNSNDIEAKVDVRFLRPSGAPLLKSYTLPPTSRTNIWVNLEEFPGLGRALASTDVSAVITSANDTPIIVERAMYRDVFGQVFGAGHESAGVTARATEWFLAEGATGPYFDLFVLIANPGPTAAQVEGSYLLPDGTTITKTYAVAGNSRFNIWVDLEDSRLANTAVATTIRSTNGVPIVVERSMWWPGTRWYEAHSSPGSTVTGTRWGLAEGEVDSTRNMETYLLVANASTALADVKITLVFEDGTNLDRTFSGIPARSRFNVPVGALFPEAAGRRFGAIVESLGTTPAQIVVERAMYWDAGTQAWAAGTNALATKLR